ncbi:MAG: hypothetical protein UR62_C0004G0006 [Candidatus Nomurabacteria bacterium GW2011_GWF2_35_12]|uniref:DUF2933 domain-containing protein n=3 Tax=Candidatus Nomuraibacteriota TaxID=1752729 RepID=A0A0G0EBD4_9BACT|nr:MAG: hypothetical protein UR62_C0004G0006 [Candidatus Nomurabacteria bacterium GW2011_GWF2_35_12]KKP72949.1 MAG: hypothetical protein UR70_C0002G0018 [Candidatus Nomurabacteria bacterium GW2011_GWB1_35_20]KKP75569.1 MAG: hypothetical protein UR72_C0004G0027 [Parcubacteria group bacterium GW2011_GWC1_35_21]KKP78619.1 MAG: hypothetical protein UR77_C0001G0005 [Candidatus Nomurabacteria bacterium GW2011_GWC2_35_35]KKP88642.1 MAG: hypothetical protein UR92_C0001G0021 [Candidatus Nomurabacteria b
MNHDNHSSKAMWWMMIPCLLLVVVILLGEGKLASFRYLWLVILGICVIPHIWMMLKGHRRHGKNDE